uniref:Uncharacterized protein n=1 Tax=Glossina pallidipes TaxID=7398 RepID=A0A1B0A4N4_GLOPL
MKTTNTIILIPGVKLTKVTVFAGGGCQSSLGKASHPASLHRGGKELCSSPGILRCSSQFEGTSWDKCCPHLWLCRACPMSRVPIGPTSFPVSNSTDCKCKIDLNRLLSIVNAKSNFPQSALRAIRQQKPRSYLNKDFNIYATDGSIYAGASSFLMVKHTGELLRKFKVLEELSSTFIKLLVERSSAQKNVSGKV